MTSNRRRRYGGLVLVLLFAVALARFLIFLPSTYHLLPGADFPAYHWGGKLLLSGEIDRLYGDEFKLFQNMPLVTIPLAPLGALDPARAWRLLWIVNLSCIVATLAVLLAGIRKCFPPLTPERALLAGALYFLFAPVMHRSLVLGQTTPIIVLLLTGFWILLRVRRPVLAGLHLGVICLVKIPPLILLALMAVRRRLRPAATALVVLALGIVLSLLLFGVDLNRQYADRVILGNANNVLAAFNNQSLVASLLRMFTTRGLTDWKLEPPPAEVAALGWIVSAALVAYVAWWCRRLWWPRRPPDDGSDAPGTLEPELGIGITLMLLLFPISWIHYYQFLVLPVTLLPFWWERAGLRRHGPAIAILLLGALLAAGVGVRANPYYQRYEFETWFRLLQCTRTVGALLLLAGFTWAAAARPAGRPAGDPPA